MANTINTSASGSQHAKTSPQRTAVSPNFDEEAKRRTALNDPAKAKEFFVLTQKYLLGPCELEEMLHEQAALINIVDVREAADFAKGHLPGAVNLPEDLWEKLAGVSKCKVNIIYSYDADCTLGTKAAVELASKGYSVMLLAGGFSSWREKEFKTETRLQH